MNDTHPAPADVIAAHIAGWFGVDVDQVRGDAEMIVEELTAADYRFMYVGPSDRDLLAGYTVAADDILNQAQGPA